MTIILSIVAFAVVFPFFWMGLVWLISRVGGWHSLARNFAVQASTASRAGAIRRGENFGWTSGRFGLLSSYNNCLNVAVCDRGINVEPVFFFKFGHEPLFFPWQSVKRISLRRFLFSHTATLHIASGDGIHAVTLYGGRLSDAIAKCAPAHLTARPPAGADR